MNTQWRTPQPAPPAPGRHPWMTLVGLAACLALALPVLLIPDQAASAIRDRLSPSFPSIPPAYTVLQPGQMVAQAKVDFPAYYVDRTNGYRVTAPDGRQFVVDNVENPKCAFYGTYVNGGENGITSPGAGITINSSVYVGEVNFDNCK